jgi:uncharacterized protein YbaR (Trm112 family)
MFIELVESLRCVREHPLTWLVARCDEMRDREIVTGVLGCPACGAEYPIRAGIADFRLEEPALPEQPAPDPAIAGINPEALAARAGGLLALTEPAKLAVLVGSWSSAAHILIGMVEQVHILAIDPPTSLGSGDGVSVLRAGGVLPLRPATTRGVALDSTHSQPEFIASAVTTLRPGGRLVASANAALPAGVRELARDGTQWVAEREVEKGLVELRRRAPTP